jgi:predicted nicotinamide N-methyase
VLDLVDDTVAIGPYMLAIRRPRNADALIDEARFGRDEFMPYWAELWPTAPALAREVERHELADARVLELGCGLALPSLVAAARGARVVAVDWAADAIELLERNAARNGLALEAEAADWRDTEPLTARAPFDLVLASDVLYEERNVEPLLELVPRLTQRVLLAEPGRPHAAAFFEAAARGWSIDAEPPLYRLIRRFAP